MPRSVLLLALLLAGSAAAQSQSILWFKDSATGTGGNAFPFGSNGIRYQTIIPSSLLPAVPARIQDFFLAGRSQDVEIVYGDIEIKMGYTQLSTMVANWTTNNPTPVTVYRGPLRTAYKVGQWRGLGLPGSFLWLPRPTNDNLCLEVIVWSVIDKGSSSTADNFYLPEAGANIPRTFLYQWVQKGAYACTTAPQTSASLGCKMGILLDDGAFVVLGKGCPGTGGTPTIAENPGTWPSLGNLFWVNLAGGAPNTPALLALGVHEWAWGGLPLPFDLTPIGGGGCRVWHDLNILLAAPVSPLGSAQLPLPIPNVAAFMGTRLAASWLNMDPKANVLGLTTSNYGKFLLGR